MRRGERTGAAPAPAEAALIVPALKRLGTLIGRLDEPHLRWRVRAALGLTLVAKLVGVGAPLLLAQGIDVLTGTGPSAAPEGSVQLPAGADGLWWVFLGLVGAWTLLRFVSTAGPQVRDAIFAPVSEEAQRRAGVAVFRHVHALSTGFHQTKRTGTLFRTIERGVRAIDFLLRFLAFNIVPTVLELALAAVVLALTFGWGFSVIAVVTVVLYAGLTLWITEWRIAHRREMNELDSAASGRAVDSLLNFETVKSFAAEEREVAAYDRAVARYARAAVRSNTSLNLLNVVQGAVMALGLAAMVAASGWLFVQGQIGAGGITAVMLILLNLYAPLNVLGFAYREIKQAAVDMEKMYALLDERLEVRDAEHARALVVSRGEIRFEGVGFVHGGRDSGLSDISFTVAPGTSTAIVGPSGAGKSTVLRLLMRFHDPIAGRILIDGQDIAQVTQVSLRQSIGLVPQDVVLFNDTIGANIAYPRPEAGEDGVREAARGAQLLDFIEALPERWATRVGERGLKLSGGEKQRVGVARVLLLDPPVLILDEATSALDSRTEAGMQAALRAAMKGRTTLVVAHRLSTIADADQILVLDQGRIVERGTHAELVAREGLYADMWRRQARLDPAEPSDGEAEMAFDRDVV